MRSSACIYSCRVSEKGSLRSQIPYFFSTCTLSLCTLYVVAAFSRRLLLCSIFCWRVNSIFMHYELLIDVFAANMFAV